MEPVEHAGLCGPDGRDVLLAEFREARDALRLGLPYSVLPGVLDAQVGELLVSLRGDEVNTGHGRVSGRALDEVGSSASGFVEGLLSFGDCHSGFSWSFSGRG
jgi:hypothetical protein